MSDRAVYLGALIVGMFVTMLGWLFTDGRYWPAFALGYIALLAYFVNLYTFQVYRGKHLGDWQQAMARLPLRVVGYGTKQGKPLEAAHDHPETLKVLIASIVVTVVVLAALAFAMLRRGV